MTTLPSDFTCAVSFAYLPCLDLDRKRRLFPFSCHVKTVFVDNNNNKSYIGVLFSNVSTVNCQSQSQSQSQCQLVEVVLAMEVAGARQLAYGLKSGSKIPESLGSGEV